MALLTGEGMGTAQLIHSLLLILVIQVVHSQLTEDKSLMMQELETGTQDTPRTPLVSEKRTSKQASLTAEGLRNSPSNRLAKLLHSSAKSRPKRNMWVRPDEQGCHLRSLLVRIKDLGLGYHSEESIVFKYCSGICPKAHSNHDMTLSVLLQKHMIPALEDPCCRPTHYEDVAFLDETYQWHSVQQLSASACSCVG